MVHTFFEAFFGLENGPVKSDKSQEKTLFGKDFPKPAKTVVGVFPMESWAPSIAIVWGERGDSNKVVLRPANTIAAV